jgi:DNA-binding transcriptional LysR family regulator
VEALDTRQLRAFQALARLQSFTAAARQLHLTQSAVSHSIKALESTLGVALFERKGRGVQLTVAGNQFLPHAQRVLREMQRAIDAVESSQRPGHGRLSIGATASISHAMLPAALREFRESFPNYEVSISTDDTRNLIAMLVSGQIDLAIGMELSKSKAYRFHHLFTDRIEMAMAPMHPLAQKVCIEPSELADQDFIIYSRESETYQLLQRGFAEIHGNTRRHLQVGSMTAIKEMARIGLGIGLVAPWLLRDDHEEERLVLRPFPWKLADRRWGLYSAQKEEPSLAEQVFIGILRDVAFTLQEPHMQSRSSWSMAD